MATTGEPFGLFWDSENGDRTYSAASFEYWLKKFFTSGVFNGDLQVKAKSGMTLEIDPGYTNVDGKVKFWNGAFTITLDAANSTYPRIDTIIIRRDNVNRQIICEKVTGSYSADTPQPTAPTRNSEIYDLVTAQIYVGAGVTEITQSNITDTRPNNELCGYITGTVEELDFSAFTAQFEAYFAEFKRNQMADFQAWEVAQQAAYAAWFNLVKQQQIQDKADWDAWYAELQEELHNLPADTAEYLQIQIDEIRDNGTTGSIFHITTTNTELEGKTVTVSCGTEVRTATFDANLECTVIGFKSVGVVTITSTDGIQTATRTLNIDYYSKYEVPIAFWSATVNIQGDDNLKGATITVKDSNDATVATVVLNVITGQGVFNAQKADAYTFNYTVSGTSYSESLAVTEETTYSLSLSAGFDWKGWVDSSKTLHSTDYNSLSEVLADEEALRQLFLVHDCVDYFAEVTSANAGIETIINTDLAAKWINLSDYALDTLYANTIIKGYMDTADKYFYGEWIITDNTTTPPTWGAKGNVPIMTANNAPYGEASASAAVSGREAYKAFDGSLDDVGWNASAVNNYVAYAFTNPVCVKRVDVMPGGASTGSRIRAFEIRGSNDNFSTYETLYTDEIPNEVGNPTIHTYTFDNNKYFKAYSLYVSSSWEDGGASSATVGARYLQFYGRELSVSVPTMTGNTTPYGEVIASATYNSTPAYRAFGGENGLLSNPSGDNYIGYDFGRDVVFSKISVIGAFSSSSISAGTIANSFVLQGTRDGETWEDILTATNINTDNFTLKYVSDDFTFVGSALRLKNLRNSNTGYGYVAIKGIQFFGLDYSEKEFEESTTKKWLYDHGVELETMNVVGTVTKGTDAIQLTAADSYTYAYNINLAPYNVFRSKVGNHASGSNYLKVWDDVASSLFTASNMPYNNGIDASSITTSNSVGVLQTANGIFDATELWLE